MVPVPLAVIMCTMTLAGSNHIDLGVFCRTGSFPRPINPKTLVIWVGKVILPCQEHYPNIELSTMSMCFKGMLFFTFSQDIDMSFPCICAKFTFCYY